MNKIIHLRIDRSYNVTSFKNYICTGTCNKCQLRFTCFTDRGFIKLNWDDVVDKHRGSYRTALQELVGGKIFVDGSKKFKALYEKTFPECFS